MSTALTFSSILIRSFELDILVGDRVLATRANEQITLSSSTPYQTGVTYKKKT